MHPDRNREALRAVIQHLESIIRLDNCPDDSEIWLAEELLKMINEELNKKVNKL